MKYIYGLTCPVSKGICYVGQTDNVERRFEQHLSDKKDTAKTRWINSLKELGRLPGYVILERVDSDFLFLDREAHWIKYGLSVGWDLRNTAVPSSEWGDVGKGLDTTRIPTSLINTLYGYNVPLSLTRTRYMPKWVQWLGIKNPVPADAVRMQFVTVDDYSFSVYYALTWYGDEMAYYENPSLHVMFSCRNGYSRTPTIESARWHEKIAAREEVIDATLETQLLYIFDGKAVT